MKIENKTREKDIKQKKHHQSIQKMKSKCGIKYTKFVKIHCKNIQQAMKYIFNNHSIIYIYSNKFILNYNNNNSNSFIN